MIKVVYAAAIFINYFLFKDDKKNMYEKICMTKDMHDKEYV